MKTYRQGEIIFKELTKEELESRMERTWAPLTIVENGVIREGEKSGHKHQVDQNTILYSDSDGNLYLMKKDAEAILDEGISGITITHPEHRALKLSGKYYRVEIQREYDEAKHSKQVLD